MLANAARLGFLLAVAALAQDGTLEGIVINSVTRGGIPGADVRVNGRDAHYETTTDAAGRFLLRNIKADDYRADVSKDGFGIPMARQGPPPVRVGGANPARIELEMTPYATLRGRVIDENRQPIAGASVQLNVSLGFRSNATTAADGSFEFTDLLPATVTLSARPKPTERRSEPEPAPRDGEVRLGQVATYYPSVTDSAQAPSIPIRGGADLTGYDIQIQRVPVYRVSGVVLDESGKPAAMITVKLAGRSGRRSLSSGTLSAPRAARRTWVLGPGGADRDPLSEVTGANGAFAFPNVPAGEWELQAESEWGRMEATKKDIQDRGHASIVVSRRDVEGLEIRLARNFELPVSVSWEPPPRSREPFGGLMLVPLDGGAMAMAMPKPDGTVRLDRVYPGRYVFAPYSMLLSGSYYIATARIGGRDVLEQQFEISSVSPPLEIVYRNKAGALRGVIERGQPAIVFLFPASKSPGQEVDFLWAIENPPEGRFEFNSLRPGEYYVVAFDRMDDAGLAKPGFLPGAMAVAKLVPVEEGSTQSVELSVTAWRE